MCNQLIESMTTNAFTMVDVLVTLALSVALGGMLGWGSREMRTWREPEEESFSPPVVSVKSPPSSSQLELF